MGGDYDDEYTSLLAGLGHKLIRNNLVESFVCKTKFRCKSKSVLEFQGIG